jgi:hypothetical protein
MGGGVAGSHRAFDSGAGVNILLVRNLFINAK